MKRIALLIIICLLFIPCIYAEETDSEDSWEYEDDVDLGGFWIQDRGFEMALAYINDAHFANNYLPANMMFTGVIKIDLDNFPSIFQAQVGVNMTPFYFKYDSKKGWGFGLSIIEFQITGFTGINFDISKITDAKNKRTDLGFAAFVNFTPSAFFHIQNFKISVMPTLFYPVAYATSKISYTLDGSKNYASFMCDIDLYTPFNYDTYSGGIQGLTSMMGMDISASVEYPLSRELGLQNIHSILNFDVGAGFTALPFIPGTMKNGLNITANASVDASDVMNITNHIFFDSQSFTKDKSIYRPFIMHFWANWKPLGTELITVTPLIGFAVNTLYAEPGSIEGGITGHLNLNNLFHVRLGINYLDRMWINSMHLALNLRLIEFNLGLSLRSQDFAKSWEGGGLGFTLGAKIGW
ncbi:MAG: hypothetical protein LBU88_11150 [Treponema sp.]|jgi:hypothetical protein|nr:hypothetical protein [Treponema sp.]